MFDDGSFADPTGDSRRGPMPELLTLALLDDDAALLDRNGFPPLRGYALAERMASPYQLQSPYG